MSGGVGLKGMGMVMVLMRVERNWSAHAGLGGWASWERVALSVFEDCGSTVRVSLHNVL